MILNNRIEHVDKKYIKYINEIDLGRVKKDEWDISKFHIMNGMIAMKNGILPFLDANGYKSDSLQSYYDIDGNEKKNMLECKHYTLYRYDYKDLDVIVHNRGDVVSVYVLYDKFSDKKFKDGDDENFKRLSDFWDRFGNFDREKQYNHMPTWKQLHERNDECTNLTWDEFREQMLSFMGYNFICFDIVFKSDVVGRYYNDHIELKKFIANGEFKALLETDSLLAVKEFQDRYEKIIKQIDRFGDNSTKRGDAFKIYLDNCLKVILENRLYPPIKNSACTCNYDYDWENMFETIVNVNLSHSQCELGDNWNHAMFDLNVDFLYTKNN